MKQYQYDYSLVEPEMFDKQSREKKADRMIRLLEIHFGKEKLKNLNVLDLGCSTGIIDNKLAKKFKQVIGIDIDKNGVKFASANFKKSNLTFKIDDALNLSFPHNQFDIIICTHVYEHVSNQEKLFAEIYRVLKPSGVCYFAAINKYWIMEPHYDLPFLAWIPKNIANIYINLAGKAKEYYESPLSYWQLRKIAKKFIIQDYTTKIFKDPKKYGFEDEIPAQSFKYSLAKVAAPFMTYLAPTFFWLLIKK